MVGHVNANSLAAVSFANSIFVIGLVAAMGISMAITPLVGQSDARNEHDKISEIFGNGTIISLLFGIVICAIMIGIIPLMDMMGQDPKVIQIAKPYYIIQVASLLPFLLFCCEKQFLEGLGNTKTAMWVSMAGVILNIILNYLLIFGKYGFPVMGALGAAIASFVVRALSPIVLTIVIYLKKNWWKYIENFSWRNITWQSMREIASIGLPIGGQSVLECMSFSISCIMVGWLGAVPLASHEIACQLSNITWMGIMGVGSATIIRISHLYGAKDYQNMHDCAVASMHLAIIYEIFTSIILIGFNRYIPYLFTNDSAVIAVAPALIICCGIYQIADGMQVIGLSILRGMTDVKRPVIYSIIVYLLISIPMGYLLITRTQLGAISIWIAFITSLTLVAILFITRYKRISNQLS